MAEADAGGEAHAGIRDRHGEHDGQEDAGEHPARLGRLHRGGERQGDRSPEGAVRHLQEGEEGRVAQELRIRAHSTECALQHF